MKPYYDEDGITIYHGDCREVLPELADESADLCLTDPPYGIGLSYGDSFDDDPEAVAALASEVVPEMCRVARAVLLTCGPSNIHLYPVPKWILAWFIPAGSGASPWGFGTWQPILAYGPDPYLARSLGRRADSITRGNQGLQVKVERERYGHPCPKPLPAWKQILLRGSPAESDLVIDPFMGSGTTIDAARALGRRAIGIEIEERYCEVAAQRLAQGVLFGATA